MIGVLQKLRDRLHSAVDHSARRSQNMPPVAVYKDEAMALIAMIDKMPPMDKPENECAGTSVYVTPVFDGEYVVRGGDDGQLFIATFADRKQADSFMFDCHRSAFLIRGTRRS